MKPSVRVLLGAAIVGTAAALLTPQPSGAADSNKLTLKAEPYPSNIRLQETDMGVVYADSRGLTLYTDRNDPKDYVPACTAKDRERRGEETEPHPDHPGNTANCLTKHIPVPVGDAKPVGAWTVFERDGEKQWAYRGHPVYTSVKDIAPGSTWNSFEPGLRQYRKRWLTVFAPVDIPPDVILQTVGAARVFATYANRTLYTLTQDRTGKSMCEGACADEWQPFLAGAMSQPRGEWALATRADGARQWTFRGRPLYTFSGDRKNGEVKGNNLPGALVAVAYDAPTPPSFMTIHTTPVGDLYGDEKGHTVYAFICPTGDDCDDVTDRSNWWFVDCGNSPEKCTKQWYPVLAAPGAKATNNTWTIVNMPLPFSPVRAAEGSKEQTVRVWAQNGRPLFTYAYDDRPAMIDGMDTGTFTGPRWFGVMATGGNLNSKKGPVTQAAR